ncbi:phosphoglucomutase [Dysgonomonas sp. PH5-45]|uniref:phospho-sugar mutase n=1 Tax=unclassified Dysgonomonas TaxID=2630389 RepID=UPI002475F972|nr:MULTISPECIES: phospho-sugar mutase [unclassified Dysgonomonas]MDH6355323.1 phosphoglucomutase [Dysgonomonas sp. PH5-45]MDH6388221.1 phosphoglucomutase [Dysgonomonas sp. PH5-37]
MENSELLTQVVEKAKIWLTGNYDEETKKEVQSMLDNEDKTELIDAFYRELEFGTGGMRGIMGAGTNRINKYTIGSATQGLANYLLKEFSTLDQIKVVIGYDCRNNSKKYAHIVADIFSANGIKAYIFEDLRPTPEVSYAIRKLGCQSGVIITASHNPKEYNGYKAYWNDGAQVVPPHDKNIIGEVNRINSVDAIRFEGNPALVEVIGEAIDNSFVEDIKAVLLSTDSIARHKDTKIVYTPIHGTGTMIVPKALRTCGFTDIIDVPEQSVVDGNFPTVVSPNPEEPAAMAMAIERAIETGAELVFATDPDSDRFGAGIRDNNGNFVLLNGNQTMIILIYYIVTRWKESGRLTGNEYTVRTIVTSALTQTISEKNGVEMFECYTGFKWIAAIMQELEGKRTYIGGGEESYGFLAEDFVRDKDAVSAAILFAEIAAWCKDKGRTLYEMLQDIYVEYGFSKEKGVSVVKKGKSGAEEIEQMMKDYRNNPIKEIAGSKVILMKDFATLKAHDYTINETYTLEMPTTSNVLQYFTEDKTKVSIRPSGTEPKIKFYIETQSKLPSRADYDAVNVAADEKIKAICKDLGI